MNPFVALWEDPVGTLNALAFVLALSTLVVLTVSACVSNAVTVRVQFEKQRPQKWTYRPPAGWLLRVASIPAVLAVDAWALGAIIHVVF